MSTYTQIIYHIVFSTKERQGTLDIEKYGSHPIKLVESVDVSIKFS